MAHQAHAVNYYVVGFAEHQLATVPTAHIMSDLIDFIENNGGVPDGNWYRFNIVANIQATILRTRELGGIVYNLPVRGP